MKRTLKLVALSLSVVLLLAALAAIPVSSDEQPVKWVNNGGTEVVVKDEAQSLFTKVNAFFEFGGFKRGTGAVGTVWDTTDTNTSANDFEVAATAGNGRIHDGYKYICWPAMHLGIKLVAPYSGKILVTYQLKNSNATRMDLIVGSDNMEIDSVGGRTNVMKTVTVEDKTETVQLTMELEVTAGTNYYFLISNMSEYKAAWFWINSVEYTEIFASTATVLGHSITLAENPVVNFYVQLEGNPMGCKADIFIGEDEVISSQVGVLATDAELEGSPYEGQTNVFKYTVPVPAKRMTETLTISIKNQGGDELLEGQDVDYSVNEYCQAQISAYKADQNAEALRVAKACTGILIYARNAQIYFNYNTSNLPVIDSDLLALVVADMG